MCNHGYVPFQKRFNLAAHLTSQRLHGCAHERTETGRGGVLPDKLGGDVRSTFQNP